MSYYNGQRIDDDFHPQEKETGIHDKGLSKYLYTERGFVDCSKMPQFGRVDHWNTESETEHNEAEEASHLWAESQPAISPAPFPEREYKIGNYNEHSESVNQLLNQSTER